ncbi:MAG TPA: hypothetical protein VFG32_05060 [Bacteroidota bacterium]|nr:hypothetical protein [Bacteroidota bacterium]
MLAYPTSWVESVATTKEAKRWLGSGIITDDQYKAIRARYTTDVYHPTLFIRIALFFFTYLCVGAAYGLLFLFIDTASVAGVSVMMVILGAMSYGALEGIISQKRLYQAGIDDALLYASLGMMVGGVIGLAFAVSDDLPSFVPCLLALPFLVWGSVRFADKVASAGAFVTAMLIPVLPLLDAGPTAKALTPFIVMGLSVPFYFITRKLQGDARCGHWRDCLKVVELLSLATFYLGGNYLVVREMSENLMMVHIGEGGDIPWAMVFYVLTVVIPCVYIGRGLVLRDHILLRIGLLAAAFSVVTFKVYFSLGHPEIILTLGGGALMLMAFLGIRFLRTPRNGMTHQNLLTNKLESLDVEAALLAQTMGSTPHHGEKQFKGEGGKFGGGGTTGDW